MPMAVRTSARNITVCPGPSSSQWYDQAGHVTSIDEGDVTTTYVHDAAGNLTKTDHPNGTTETRTYDDAGRTLTIDTPDVDSWS